MPGGREGKDEEEEKVDELIISSIETPEEVLLRLMQIEEQLAYAYARCSVLHRVKAKELRDVLYEEAFPVPEDL